jgi:hypothetical protein
VACYLLRWKAKENVRKKELACKKYKKKYRLGNDWLNINPFFLTS